MHQHEAASAIGVLDIAGAQAGLPQQGGLLIASHAADAKSRRTFLEQAGLHPAKVSNGRQDLGQQAARYIKKIEQFLVPLAGMDIEQQGAAGIADVGHVPATCELPYQPGIDGAKSQLARSGPVSRTGYMVEHPPQFGG